MSRKLKVYGYGSHFERGIQYRLVVAAPSQKEAAAAFGINMYEFTNYAGETGNVKECETALDFPGVVFGCPLNEAFRNVGNYKRMTIKPYQKRR